MGFGLLWEAGLAAAFVAAEVGVAAAAVVPPAGSADIAGNAGAGILGTTPLKLETKLGCRETGSPYCTLAAGSLPGEPRGSADCSTEKSQA